MNERPSTGVDYIWKDNETGEVFKRKSPRALEVPVMIFDRSATTVDWQELRALRHKYGIVGSEFGKFGISEPLLSRTERGKSTPTLEKYKNFHLALVKYPYEPFTMKVRTSLRAMLDVSNPAHLRMFDEVSHQESVFEAKRWIATLAPLTLGDSIRQLVLADARKQVDFLTDVDSPSMSTTTLSEIIKDVHIATQFSLNSILNASLLNSFDNDNHVMQLVRLKTIDTIPMDKDKLETNTYGTLFKYARVAMGYSQPLFAKTLGIPLSLPTKIETSNRHTLPDENQQRLNALLGINENDALYHVWEQKRAGHALVISDDKFKEIRQGKLFFSKPEDFVDPARIPPEDNLLLTKLRDGQNTITQLVEAWRKKYLISQTAFAQRANVGRTTLIDMEKGRINPEDRNMVKILGACGYDIHHPITQHVLAKTSR